MSDLSQAVRSTLLLLAQTRTSSGLPRLGVRAQASIVLACFSAAVLVRALVGVFVPGVVPYTTFFPAIALAALVGGFWPGCATWLLSIVAGLLFVSRAPFSDLTIEQAASATLFAFAAGFVLLIASSFRDLLWRVWRSEARYRVVADVSVNFVSVFDENGACLEPQPGWEAVTGMRWPAYQGFAWLEAVHEEDRDKLRLANATMNDGPATIEVRIRDQAIDDWRWFRVRTAPLRSIEGRAVLERVGALTDISESKAAQERRDLLLQDMRHRLKNFMSIIQGLVMASLPKDDPGAKLFADKLMLRVRALEAAGDLVMKANAQDVDIADVVPAAIAPFLDAYGTRIAIGGPHIFLKESTVGGLALACNELITNAMKYGALSNASGAVSIQWRTEPIDCGEKVTFEFIESGGPPVRPPSREGFGTRIIRMAAQAERNRVIELKYDRAGLRCSIAFTRIGAEVMSSELT